MEGNLFTSFSKEAMKEKDLPCELRWGTTSTERNRRTRNRKAMAYAMIEGIHRTLVAKAWI